MIVLEIENGVATQKDWPTCSVEDIQKFLGGYFEGYILSNRIWVFFLEMPGNIPNEHVVVFPNGGHAGIKGPMLVQAVDKGGKVRSLTEKELKCLIYQNRVLRWT